MAPRSTSSVLPDDVDNQDLGRCGRLRGGGGGCRQWPQQNDGADTNVLAVEGGDEGQDVLAADQLRLLSP
jgi:hypothetical protein